MFSMAQTTPFYFSQTKKAEKGKNSLFIRLRLKGKIKAISGFQNREPG